MYQSFEGEFLEFTFSVSWAGGGQEGGYQQKLSHFPTINQHGGDKIVLDAEQCRQTEAEILGMHAIPAITSKGLLDDT